MSIGLRIRRHVSPVTEDVKETMRTKGKDLFSLVVDLLRWTISDVASLHVKRNNIARMKYLGIIDVL